MGPTLIACAPAGSTISSRGRAGDSDGRGAADPRNGGDRLHRNAFAGQARRGVSTHALPVRGSSLKVARDHLGRFGAELVYGDLTDSGSLGAATEGVTTVFHLGGDGTAQMTSMDDCLRINLDATRASWTRRPTNQSATPPSSSANCKPSAIASPSRRWRPWSIRGIFTTAQARSCAEAREGRIDARVARSRAERPGGPHVRGGSHTRAGDRRRPGPRPRGELHPPPSSRGPRPGWTGWGTSGVRSSLVARSRGPWRPWDGGRHGSLSAMPCTG
jgi:hypothetical protein